MCLHFICLPRRIHPDSTTPRRSSLSQSSGDSYSEYARPDVEFRLEVSDSGALQLRIATRRRRASPFTTTIIASSASRRIAQEGSLWHSFKIVFRGNWVSFIVDHSVIGEERITPLTSHLPALSWRSSRLFFGHASVPYHRPMLSDAVYDPFMRNGFKGMVKQICVNGAPVQCTDACRALCCDMSALYGYVALCWPPKPGEHHVSARVWDPNADRRRAQRVEGEIVQIAQRMLIAWQSSISVARVELVPIYWRTPRKSNGKGDLGRSEGPLLRRNVAYVMFLTLCLDEQQTVPCVIDRDLSSIGKEYLSRVVEHALGIRSDPPGTSGTKAKAAAAAGTHYDKLDVRRRLEARGYTCWFLPLWCANHRRRRCCMIGGPVSLVASPLCAKNVRMGMVVSVRDAERCLKAYSRAGVPLEEWPDISRHAGKVGVIVGLVRSKASYTLVRVRFEGEEVKWILSSLEAQVGLLDNARTVVFQSKTSQD